MKKEMKNRIYSLIGALAVGIFSLFFGEEDVSVLTILAFGIMYLRLSIYDLESHKSHKMTKK